MREWPFDTSTFLRFALYLLIPMGSWFGGAVVERLLREMIDGASATNMLATPSDTHRP